MHVALLAFAYATIRFPVGIFGNEMGSLGERKEWKLTHTAAGDRWQVADTV